MLFFYFILLSFFSVFFIIIILSSSSLSHCFFQSALFLKYIYLITENLRITTYQQIEKKQKQKTAKSIN